MLKAVMAVHFALSTKSFSSAFLTAASSLLAPAFTGASAIANPNSSPSNIDTFAPIPAREHVQRPVDHRSRLCRVRRERPVR
ncbi:uncharacterized protein BXZ73DRAFT_105629 [Epithele typhae]|uniref:uncharacterized protein n=1 Tax=Epithele typhae TaxID=378194 RepID=UPI002008AC65|nr:uncharacterized protein BXZ73DRAFT_105629 [Epithele typhae]KAH9917157.1 hypothetical protein BXZ73DRAFT_105629 [Epithele typhae]